MSSNTPNSAPGPLEQMASFMVARARDVGVTESQVLQLLGFRNPVGPIETLLSGRPSETIPAIAKEVFGATDGVISATRQQVEQAIPIVVIDEMKPLIRKMSMLDAEGVRHLDVYLNFLVSQGFIKK